MIEQNTKYISLLVLCSWNCRPVSRTNSVLNNLSHAQPTNALKISCSISRPAKGCSSGRRFVLIVYCAPAKTFFPSRYWSLLKATISLSLTEALRYARYSISGSKKSSASRNDKYSPVAYFIPLFLAAPAPAFFWVITFTSWCASSYSFKIANELSVEPSSTQITSILWLFWTSNESRHCLIYFSALYTGIITETLTLA